MVIRNGEMISRRVGDWGISGFEAPLPDRHRHAKSPTLMVGFYRNTFLYSLVNKNNNYTILFSRARNIWNLQRIEWCLFFSPKIQYVFIIYRRENTLRLHKNGYIHQLICGTFYNISRHLDGKIMNSLPSTRMVYVRRTYSLSVWIFMLIFYIEIANYSIKFNFKLKVKPKAVAHTMEG